MVTDSHCYTESRKKTGYRPHPNLRHIHRDGLVSYCLQYNMGVGGALHYFVEGVNCFICPPRGQSVNPFIHPCSMFSKHIL